MSVKSGVLSLVFICSVRLTFICLLGDTCREYCCHDSRHSKNSLFAVSNSYSEAQIFFEDYLDRRDEVGSLLELTKARVTKVQMAGKGDHVCVDLCSVMKPGEGLLVGSFARWLFLVHSECLESNYISSRPFRINAESSSEFRKKFCNPHLASALYAFYQETINYTQILNGTGSGTCICCCYRGKTSYLSELKSGKMVIIVDQSGMQRTTIVGHVKIET